jgi:multidrug transporter EmrE-like cation transporter
MSVANVKNYGSKYRRNGRKAQATKKNKQPNQMFHWQTLGFGLLLGSIDAIVLPLTKAVSTGWSTTWMIPAALLHSITPFIFLTGLKHTQLTILNPVWDLTSVILVTFFGLFVFKEKLSTTKLIGVALSFIALTLMTVDEEKFTNWIR